jgi:hypothetical protein
MRGKQLLLTLALTVLTALPALAATEVKMAGDARIYGLFFANRNFTGRETWNGAKEERFSIWQRMRLRTDFVASESVKFRLGLTVEEDSWGHGYLTAANPQTAVMPYLAYLQFKWPQTDIEITAGLQPVSMPQASGFCDSIVLAADDGDQSSAALVLTAPLYEDAVSLQLAYARLFAANQTFRTVATNNQDGNFDVYHLSVPVKLDGFEVTPWGLAGVIGKNRATSDFLAANSGSAESFANGYRYNQNLMWWTGLALNVDALDPVKLSFDAIYGEAAPNDRSSSKRRGYFFDGGVSYTGLDWMVPGLFGWVASGEDGSIRNGSERLPVLLPKWGPGTSFLFDCDQDFSGNNMMIDPTGTWGLMASLRDISFVDKLTSRVSFGFVAGTNSRAGLRKAYATAGDDYVKMGRNLALGEWALGVSFDHSYELYENLTLNLQTGFASPQGLKTSVWGHENTELAKDAWMVALGMLYTF